MARDYHPDLPIAIYVLIGWLVVGAELVGLTRTIQIAAALVGLFLAVSLALAMLRHVMATPLDHAPHQGSEHPAQMGGAGEFTNR